MAECSCQIVRCCPRSRRRQRGTPCRRKIPPDKTRWDLLRIETVASPRRAFDGGTGNIADLRGRLIAAPTGAPAAVSRRRGGYQPPGPHRRNCRACGHCSPPLRHAIGLVRRAGCPHPAYAGCRNRGACGHRDPAMAACGHAALRGPAGVWRESGAFRAADSRPYAMPSAWSVGRGAHTPPNQAAGITGPAVRIAGQFGRIYNPPLRGTRCRFLL